MDDPNNNPAWDRILGQKTDNAVIRLIGLVAAFVLVGGTLFWMIG